MAVTFTEPDEPSSSSSSSSSSADDDGTDSADGNGSDTDSGSDGGYEEDPRYAAAEVDCQPTAIDNTPQCVQAADTASDGALCSPVACYVCLFCTLASSKRHKTIAYVLLCPSAHWDIRALGSMC